MSKFILHTLVKTIPQSSPTNDIMHDSTLNAFEEQAYEEQADKFAKDLAQKAKELEVTVDYYIMEFM